MGRRILLVDDDEQLRSLAARALELLGGHQVLALESAQAAIRKAATFAPELIILDVMMPFMDGPATLAALRRQPTLASVPAVFLTSRTQATDVGRLRALGAVDVIAKPFEGQQLCDRVDALFGGTPIESAPAASENPLVLLVEDDPSIRFLIGFMLEQQGFRLAVAEDGNQGFAAVTTGPPVDLVLLDIMMPGMDGIELLGHLRRHWPSTPVIMLTAKGDEKSVVRAMAAGANDYVVKPFAPSDLVDRVRTLLKLGSKAASSAS
ncbi:MAG: response regulator [Pseudomonadota bacterium]